MYFLIAAISVFLIGVALLMAALEFEQGIPNRTGSAMILTSLMLVMVSVFLFGIAIGRFL